MLRTAGRLALFQGGTVQVLQVIVIPEPIPLEMGHRRASASREILEKTLAIANEEKLPIQITTRAARSTAQGILDTANEEKPDLIVLGWGNPDPTQRFSLGQIADAVLQDAPCNVVIVRGEHIEHIQRILVPTSGGPHAQVATQLATLLMKALQAQVTLLNVQSQVISAEQMEENRRKMIETIKDLDIKPPPEQKFVTATSIAAGIIQEAQNYDIVLLGVSDANLLDRLVFGSIPLQVAERVPQTALVQAYRGLTKIWTRRLLRALRQALPALSTKRQQEIRDVLERDAQPGVNFFVLIVLSCLIAALGLLLNSPAVVIGAMLIAPLMSPILALSMGLILGDLRMVRSSVEALLKGVALAVLITAFVGLLSPLKVTTDEMLARGQPTPLDMVVALASGIAGAYATARKNVSAALPGVSIAAALMPPLATAGLGLAMGNAHVAGGAMLLFLTNIAAISLAASLVFILLGIRPQRWGPDSRRQLRRRLIASLLVLLAIAVPLGIIFAGIVQKAAREQQIREAITEHLGASDSQLVALEVEQSETKLLVSVTVRSMQVAEQSTVDNLAQMLSERMNRSVQIELTVLPILRSP
jgi:uncharacterized hydrophobic protein (TIGR00271 family)